ncbi:ras-related GTP-binding protein C isoform X3 [Rhopalosiphum maidis]|uniref:ras-related GTP-binding protein C isoform X2 n=1 Tax=Rhopalosiphum maidis TaxID=43146 RepID=UPI000F00DCF7|nr:ras-related GTP-binding protein C isoform X2 [Rhopalosiphum maidis]XP_026804733.1 ras-related GTP-binding protein C isoform X3 [Rhopalosiphum maidis]
MSFNRVEEESFSTTFDIGSLPKHYEFNEFISDEDAESDRDDLPRLVLMGLRGSGKTSIQKVVFQKMSPNETLFIGSNNSMLKDVVNNSAFVNFQICDFPGHFDFADSEYDIQSILQGCQSLVFVIDAQDAIASALNRLHSVVTKAYKINKNIKFEVFIHKVDGLTEDTKMETQREIHQRANDDLVDSGDEQKIYISFHLTSIYDHSIFEAFSRVVQKMIPHYATLENFLNIIIQTSGIEKAFLYDVKTKIYVATDSSPVDIQSYELCCDMIDVVIDLSNIYGSGENPGLMNDPAFDDQSSSLIKLNNGTILYLREVCSFLALVCILREDNFEKQRIIDYNFVILRKGIHKLFELKDKEKESIEPRNPPSFN